jgi:hypothetical protein
VVDDGPRKGRAGYTKVSGGAGIEVPMRPMCSICNIAKKL